MSYHIRFAAILVGLSFIASATSVQATLIGNDVSVGRPGSPNGAPSDGGVLDITDGEFHSNDGAMALQSATPMPGPGIINAFAIFDDSANAGLNLNFDAVVLHPVGGNDYQVLAVDLLTAAGTGAEHLYPVAPISVSAGDLIAEVGQGVPFAFAGGGSDLYYPLSTAPVASTTITLGAGEYSLLTSDRNYAFAANFVAVPEPSSFLLIAAGCGLLGLKALRRNRKPAETIQA